MQRRLSNGSIDFTYYRREATRRRRIAKRLFFRQVIGGIRNGLTRTLGGSSSHPIANGRQPMAIAARG